MYVLNVRYPVGSQWVKSIAVITFSNIMIVHFSHALQKNVCPRISVFVSEIMDPSPFDKIISFPSVSLTVG